MAYSPKTAQSKKKAWFVRALVPALFIIGAMIGYLFEFRPEAIGGLGSSGDFHFLMLQHWTSWISQTIPLGMASV
jgi:hypothetical protein